MKKTLLILAALLCCCFALKAQNFTHNRLKYRVTGTNPPTVALTGHTEDFAAHNFVTPSTVTYDGTTYSVTSIGEWAFENCLGLTGSLTISNSVTSIETGAFWQCVSLSGTLHIGNSVTDIGRVAFCGRMFTGSLNIPNSVTRIEDHAFDDNLFNGTLTLGNSLEHIGEFAFRFCGFTGSLVIPESVTNIGHGAFLSPFSNFDGTLTIGSSQMTIKEKAFSSAKFKKIIIKTEVSPNMEEGSLDGMSRPTSIIVPCGRAEYYGNHPEWGNYWELISQDMLFSVTVSADDPNHGTVRKTQPDDCSYITASATATPNEGFTFAGWMENDTLVTTENPYIFDLTRNRNLTAVFEGPWHDITVSANPAEAGTVSAIYKGEPVTSAPEGGFITAVATPTDDYIFSNWTESGSPISYANPYTFTVTCERNLTANFVRQNYDFYATCTTGQTLYYKITDAEQHLVRIVAPNSNDQNGWGESKPTGSITLPETVRHNGTDYTVTEIGDYAFYRCENLNGSLAIPNTVTEIGDWAFYNCIGFSGTLTIGNSVTSIGNNAFQFCKHFTGSLTIPNSVTSIGNYAFQQCEELSGTLTLGSSLESIGISAFNKTGFTQIITKRDTPPTLGTEAFFRVDIESVIVPCGKASVYESESGWNSFIGKYGQDMLYTLNVSQASEGQGSATILQMPSSCDDNEGKVEATPFPNYIFAYWSENGTMFSEENPCTFHLDRDYSLVANFKAIYNIAVSANPEEAGTAMATCGGEPVESALEGTSITVTASPTNGYKFVNWTENGEVVSTENPYTFTLENDRNLVANFAAKQLCHISVSVGSEGTGTVTATCGGEPVESALEGSEITVSATHAEGYVFLNWTENGRPVSTSSTYTFTLESDRNLVANFTQYTYVPVTSLPTPTTDPLYVIGYQDGDDFYLHNWGGFYNDQMHLSKNPANPIYYHFDMEYGGSLIGFICAKVGFGDYLKIEEGNVSVAHFLADGNDLPYSIEISSNGDIYSRGSNGNVLYHDGDIVKVHNGSNDNLCFFRVTRYCPVIVSASPAEGGTVSATCEGQEVTQALEGSTITVTATPAEGYMFKNWTEYVRIVSTDNPYSFGIGNYCNLVANFVEPQYDFSATCETGQTLYYRINDAEQHWVSIVAPLGDDPSGWGNSKPEGNIVLPQTVIHDGIEYVVTEIGDYAFYNCHDLRGLLDIPVTVTRIGDFAFYYDGWINTTLSISDQVKSIGASAFKNRFIESIYIGNSVESIGSEALCVFDNTDRHFVSKAQTPPDFEGGFIYMYFPHQTHQRIYIHIPKNTLAAYQSAWGDKYDYIEMNDCAFWPGIYDMWQFWENWAPNQQLPVPYDNVTIYGNCLLDIDATVTELRVAAGKKLTIGEGKTLTALSIILENGAQLINNGTVNCNDITVEKDIEDYGEDSGGWYLVSSPVTASAYTSGMATAQAANYDLYRFSQTGDSQGREWLNYKAGAFLMENQSSYLYANRNNKTIVFRGRFAATEAKALEYVEGVDFPGFNLVGNPYPCNATISGTDLRSSNYFYRMNASGTDLEVVAEPLLAPCTGVFAVAANDQATVTFTQADATANVTRGEKKAVQDIRVELLADGKVIDRAYLNMNGESLPKFRLQDNASEICFYQNKEELAVASTSSTSGEMPLNFKAAKNGSYTITVNVENADLNYLHLVDNLTGNDVDLLGSEGDAPWHVSTYTFDAKTSDYASRFKLVFGVKGDAASADSAGDFAFISNGEIIVSNEGRATLQVIDVMGRIVSSEEINGECRISTNGLTAGVYVLNLNGMTQKIVVR